MGTKRMEDGSVEFDANVDGCGEERRPGRQELECWSEEIFFWLSVKVELLGSHRMRTSN